MPIPGLDGRVDSFVGDFGRREVDSKAELWDLVGSARPDAIPSLEAEMRWTHAGPGRQLDGRVAAKLSRHVD